MTRHAHSERLLLADSLDRLGPDAPTLCTGWKTRNLATHLVIRDSRPDLVVGRFVPFVSTPVKNQIRRIARSDYSQLVSRVRQGAPAWNPTSWQAVDERANLLEFFVHHEDVLRAEDGWAPRPLETELEEHLWAGLRRFARIAFRRSPTGIVLVAEGFGRHAARLPDERGTVVLRGRPQELVLYAFGRTGVARVDLSGDADDIAALQAGQLGV
ncbi:MAG: TIGR03085 family metal-binding protein [Intrasporangium sp.]|uniref:TIGR03085 family metal-binding protein n=1 Tax=Intrasporangium sp. TaxID=1925024 RepID=UPI0026492CF3|nr:TIGR03085 family metal-binding protein [Intrasporangium sp.]MDN5797538.1 TIGR03085 family metal-binding protein [Intrasporangium sp.]